MSQVTTTTVTLTPVTVMCTGALDVGTTVAIASTLVVLPGALGWNNKVMSPPLVLMYTVSGVAGFTALSQQHPQAQMGTQNSMPFIIEAYTIYVMCP